MCTLTILPLGGKSNSPPAGDGLWLRVANNRDESVLRSPALPPRVGTYGTHQGMMPIDPDGGGTWVGANDSGLVLSLLNTYSRPLVGFEPRSMPAGMLSRGTIIPALLSCGRLAEALSAARQLDAGSYRPFRLVLIDRNEVIELSSAAGRIDVVSRQPLTHPLMFTSSGLGDEYVDNPRRKLFDEMFTAADPAAWPAIQDAYHRHQWPDRPDISVCMRRIEARTVSLTEIEVGRASVTMTYFPAPPEQPSESTTTWISDSSGTKSHDE